MKVLSEKMNVLGLDTSKLTKAQLASANSDAIDQKFKKVSYLIYWLEFYIKTWATCLYISLH